jgi:pyridoxamine 5'-phosphate oxidase
LERRVAELERMFEGKEIPCPPHWGGIRVIAERIEFWSGRENRLHDRILYERTFSGWKASRLAP